MANKSAVLAVKIVGDSRNLQSALRRASSSVASEMARISNAQKRIASVTNGLLRMATGFTKVGLLSAALLVASSNLAVLTGGLLSVVGILPVLPGLLAGFAVGALVTGLALKDIGTVLADLGPAFTNLQDSISAKFWDQAAQPIRDLVNTTLPSLKDGLDATATATGSFFAELAGSLQHFLTPSVVGGLFTPLIESINIAKGALSPLVEAFITLGAVGGQYLPALAGWFVDLSGKFNTFIQGAASDGTLKGWIDGAISTFKTLGSIIGSVGGILGGIFTAAKAAGGSTLEALAGGLQRISDVVNGPVFQGVLTNLFKSAHTAMSNLFSALGPVSDAFVTLAPILGTILETVGTLAGTALSTLANVLMANAPLIEQIRVGLEGLGSIIVLVGSFISQHAQAFTALAIVIGTLVAVIKIATVVTGIFNAVMAINPIAIIIIAVAALVAGIIYLATQTTFFQDVWAAMTRYVNTAITNVTTGFKTAWNAAVDFVTGVVRNVGKFIRDVVQNIRNAWNVAFNFIRNIVTSVIANVQQRIGEVRSFIGTALSAVQGIWNNVFNAVRNIVANVISGVINTIGRIRETVSSVINSVRNFFSDGFNSARNTVSNVVNGIVGFINNISSAVQNAIGWVQNLFNQGMPGWISDAMSFLGMGGTGFDFTGQMSFSPSPAPVGGFGTGATGLGIAGILGGSSSRTEVHNNYYEVNFNGLMTDPHAAAREIKKLLNQDARKTGAITVGETQWP